MKFSDEEKKKSLDNSYLRHLTKKCNVKAKKTLTFTNIIEIHLRRTGLILYSSTYIRFCKIF